MLAVWEHRELVQVFGEPRRGFGDVDKAVLDDRGLCVHPHRLLVGRLVARDAMAALGDQILDKRDWRTNAGSQGRCNFRVSSGVADRKFAAEDLHPRQRTRWRKRATTARRSSLYRRPMSAASANRPRSVQSRWGAPGSILTCRRWISARWCGGALTRRPSRREAATCFSH